jgi:hypothetical protein
MFLLIHAKYNLGISGGYSHHGIRISEVKKSKYKIERNDLEHLDENAPPRPLLTSENSEIKYHALYTHGGFVKGQFSYNIYTTNNLYIHIQGFLGHTWGTLTQTDKPILSLGFFGGIAGKFELDFEELRSLYLLLGLQLSHPTLNTFNIDNTEFKIPTDSNSEFRLTPIIGLGGSIYLTKRTSLFCEITHSGYLSSHYISTENHGIQKFYNPALRIGAGINVKFDSFNFSEK